MTDHDREHNAGTDNPVNPLELNEETLQDLDVAPLQADAVRGGVLLQSAACGPKASDACPVIPTVLLTGAAPR